MYERVNRLCWYIIYSTLYLYRDLFYFLVVTLDLGIMHLNLPLLLLLDISIRYFLEYVGILF